MSIDEKTDLEGTKSFPNGDGLQAVSGPADGSAPKYRDEENGPGAAHEVRINGIGESHSTQTTTGTMTDALSRAG